MQSSVLKLIVIFLGRLIRTARLVEFRKFFSLEAHFAQHGYLVHYIGTFLPASTTVCGLKSSFLSSMVFWVLPGLFVSCQNKPTLDKTQLCSLKT